MRRELIFAAHGPLTEDKKQALLNRVATLVSKQLSDQGYERISLQYLNYRMDELLWADGTLYPVLINYRFANLTDNSS